MHIIITIVRTITIMPIYYLVHKIPPLDMQYVVTTDAMARCIISSKSCWDTEKYETKAEFFIVLHNHDCRGNNTITTMMNTSLLFS